MFLCCQAYLWEATLAHQRQSIATCGQKFNKGVAMPCMVPSDSYEIIDSMVRNRFVPPNRTARSRTALSEQFRIETELE